MDVLDDPADAIEIRSFRRADLRASGPGKTRPLIFWRARQESNLYQELRKLSFYPLNYGREEALLYRSFESLPGRPAPALVAPRVPAGRAVI